MIRTPEDQSELENWVNDPITQWFFKELAREFDPHQSILWADEAEKFFEIKGEQRVMKFIRNPGDLLNDA